MLEGKVPIWGHLGKKEADQILIKCKILCQRGINPMQPYRLEPDSGKLRRQLLRERFWGVLVGKLRKF